MAAKHDHDVCLAAVYLGEGERGHIAPHLECPSEGVIDHGTVQVGGVVYHPARESGGQCCQVPSSCRSDPVLGRNRSPPPDGIAATTPLELTQGSDALLGIGEQMLLLCQLGPSSTGTQLYRQHQARTGAEQRLPPSWSLRLSILLGPSPWGHKGSSPEQTHR